MLMSLTESDVACCSFLSKFSLSIIDRSAGLFDQVVAVLLFYVRLRPDTDAIDMQLSVEYMVAQAWRQSQCRNQS